MPRFRCFAVALILTVRAFAADPTVFESAPAPVTAPLREGIPAAGGPMRTLTVTERVGVARATELVRVPLFFHAGECADPNGLTIYDLTDASKTPIAYQADDIRRAESGEVARMHVYFYAALQPWERKQFAVIKGKNPATGSVGMTESGDSVTFKADDLTMTVLAKGDKAGAVTQLETSFGKLNLLDGFIAPQVRLVRQDAKLKELRRTELDYTKPENLEIREIKFATGPLFAKFRATIGPKGLPDSCETTFLIPKAGSHLIITQRTFADDPETGDVVASNWPALLRGRVTFGGPDDLAASTDIPTGLRKLLREVQNQRVEAAIAKSFSVVNVPIVSNGGEIHYQTADPLPERVEDGKTKKADPPKFTMSFMGPGSLKRNGDSNSGSIRAFWTQSRLVFANTTDVEKLWDVVRTGQNGVVAVVDEPGVSIDDFAANLKDIGGQFYKIKHWGKGWAQEAGMEYLTGKEDAMKKRVEAQANPPKNLTRGDDGKLENWAPSWAREQWEANGRLPGPIKPPEKTQLDRIKTAPYEIGYSLSSIVPFAKYIAPSERLDQMCDSIARGSMIVNGRLYKEGLPYINAFSNAYNMQVGSIMFGLYAGKKLNDPQMTLFYRDVTKSNGVAGIYGHGERGYSGDMRSREQSDVLYQAISDNWMRCAELQSNEDLSIHPATYSRYTDAIDVTADLQHRGLTPANKSNGMANFFRAQQHDHRWESWDVMPYVMLSEHADEDTPAGLTAACYYVRDEVAWMKANDKTPNHAQLTQYVHPLMNLRTVRHDFKPPTLPALPGNIKAVSSADGVRITWSPVDGAVGYRVYRSERIGKPLTLLNSPYRKDDPKPLVKETAFTDPTGSPDRFYFVTALDKDGFESNWFPDEPQSRPGKNAK